MAIMYKVYNTLIPVNILSYFQMVHTPIIITIQKKENTFKNKYCGKTLKSIRMCVKGPILWNHLDNDMKNNCDLLTFKKLYDTFLVNKYIIYSYVIYLLHG